MKKFVLFIIIFWANDILSQSQQLDNSLLPKINVPSPEAFKFSTYGEIPVNESSGKTSTDIPIFTYKAGRIEFPISIFHNGGGVKVDEISTTTGIGWQLNAGGVITRLVNDLDDLTTPSNKRKFKTYSQLVDLINYHLNTSQELVDIADNNVDSEVDIFNFNFNGNSGSFYLDETFTPRLIKYDKEVKIEVLNNNTLNNDAIIVITNTDGVKYYFGGGNASESTRFKSQTGQMMSFAQTSFYLYKIQNTLGDIIDFTYNKTGTSGELMSIDQRLTIDRFSIVNCSTFQYELTSKFNTSFNNLETSGKLRLSKISSNVTAITVDFDYSLQSSTSLNRHILNSIIVKNNQYFIKKAKLEYLTTNTGRFFLEKLKFVASNNLTIEYQYKFEYNKPDELPDRFSKAQDYGGYYNGKIYNTNFIHDVTYDSDNTGWQFADRDPVLDFSIKGTLKKVIYPTGGYTEFEYELPYKGTRVKYNATNPIVVYYRDLTRTPNSTSVNPNIINGYNQYEFMEIAPEGNGSYSVENWTNFKVDFDVNVNGIFSHPVYTKYIAINTANQSQIVANGPTINASSNSYLDFSKYGSATLNLPPGSYIFKVVLQIHCTDSHNCITLKPNELNSARLTAVLKIPYNASVYSPELRIKRIKKFDDRSEYVTRYYYNKAANRYAETDSRTTVNSPLYKGDAILQFVCPRNPETGFSVIGAQKVMQNVYSSSSINSMYASDSNSSVYQYVTVSYGGDNFEKGGKELYFHVEQDLACVSLTFTDGNYYSKKKYSNNSMTNGTLLKETYFTNNVTFNYADSTVNNGKVKEVNYVYKTDFTKNYEINNCNTSVVHSSSGTLFSTPGGLYVGNIYYGHYRTYSRWFAIESVTTKEFLENGTLVNTTNYFYDTKLAGLPTKIITNNSNGTETTIENKYVNQFTELDGLNATQNTAYNTMRIQNNIATPIQIKQYEGAHIISTKRSLFKMLSANSVVLEKIQIAKDNLALEDRVFFEEYDLAGNPTIVYLNGGVKIKYLYNSNYQPIVKIENFTGSLSPNTRSISNPCSFINQYPTAKVTIYEYENNTNLLKIIYDNNCRKTFFEYDDFNRLKYVKDNEGNILNENAYNYRP